MIILGNSDGSWWESPSSNRGRIKQMTACSICDARRREEIDSKSAICACEKMTRHDRSRAGTKWVLYRANLFVPGRSEERRTCLRPDMAATLVNQRVFHYYYWRLLCIRAWSRMNAEWDLINNLISSITLDKIYHQVNVIGCITPRTNVYRILYRNVNFRKIVLTKRIVF